MSSITSQSKNRRIDTGGFFKLPGNTAVMKKPSHTGPGQEPASNQQPLNPPECCQDRDSRGYAGREEIRSKTSPGFSPRQSNRSVERDNQNWSHGQRQRHKQRIMCGHEATVTGNSARERTRFGRAGTSRAMSGTRREWFCLAMPTGMNDESSATGKNSRLVRARIGFGAFPF